MEINLFILIVFGNCLISEGKCLQADYVSCEITNEKQCIPVEWWCDGHRDCENGRDELNCTFSLCRDNEIACKTGTQCIPKFLRCDGFAQCLDQSDEDNCTLSHKKSCNYRIEFDCYNDGQHCIDLNKVCDSGNDCGRNQDEYPGGLKENCQRDDCRATFNGGCSHFCTNLFTEIVCHCRNGYRLLADNKTCVDIDECSLNPARCLQICNNTDGGYQCLCHEGYRPNLNVFSECIAKEGDRVILVTLEKGDIFSFDLENNNHIVHNLTNLSNDWTNIDIHVLEPSKIEIFWTSFKDKNIAKTIFKRIQSNHFEAVLEIEIFRMYNGSFCGGLSYDWLRSLLFWSSSEDAKLYVTNSTSNQTSILLQTDLDYPRSIAVDPFLARIYWIDWGYKLSSPRIESMLMDNSDRRIIIKDGLRQPQALSIDFLDHRLYWCDINPGSIEFIDLSRSTTRRTIIYNQLLHPFALFIFEGKVFWTDWRLNQVLSIDKTLGNNMKLIKKLFKPMSIGIMNGLVKPMKDSRKSQIYTCINSQSNPCSDLCLPSLSTIKDSDASVKCICEIGSVMSSDNQFCTPGLSSLILPRNIHRFKIIAAVMLSLVIIFLLFIVIIVFYICRDRLCSKSYSHFSSTQEVKHHLVSGDLMFIFRCQSHSSQLSELLNNDFSSSTIA